MGRAAVAAAIACAAGSGAAGAAPLSVQLGVGSGVGWARLAGAYRDDAIATARVGLGLGPLVALDVGLAEDLERVEPALTLGARVRTSAGARWACGWSPYLRAQLALVGASHLGSNYDLLLGAGHWGRVAPHLAWFVELDGVARVGEYDTLAARIEAGVALTTRTFWH